MPGVPKLYFGVVDVRDVADLHLRAMTNPAAKGERFLAVASDFMSMLDLGKVLKTIFSYFSSDETAPGCVQYPRPGRRAPWVRY